MNAQRRRAQVLEAASLCFREKGFHGTSMAQISAAAGMSIGHIYHYFKSKEDIIAGIVERERDEVELLLAGMRDAANPEDAIAAFANGTERSVEMNRDISRAALKMEILAEAARNPAIAEVVHRHNAEIKAAHQRIFDAADPKLEARMELTAALMEGLSVRALRNPDLDKQIDLDLMRDVVRCIFSAS
ncbi:TetR/AcrR family transcriptional regulator [Sphingobium lactosutens]|uniref:HTH tetR-type domain-containing protein n=1 Tax=Sphingobium lactosutens DS20 TaxID=1331060 RepID=T0HPJ8_9SPHN|nr:TetR family transcriptional regulator [Sphingobium lactosutens]EQB14952.1 hypothetical protein RLDS_12335 [Sphingobium lactosutens DS20]